ncbi:hypothetical protein ACFYV5_07855 [Streptomyces sp. NPDC003035]|uniref:hypothetical protein n=1 Tax=unclassified Streptomyces TaxID=2593676 RepID=UPI0033A87512
MTTTEAEAARHFERCEQLFLAGGKAAVRRAAQEGLDALGPTADLYCWLAVGHAAEDEDDHDDRAEEAYRAGLRLDPDHLGLLAGYTELCLRADGFEYPGRAARAVALTARIKALAPESAEAQRVESAHRWHDRGYWEDIRFQVARAGVTSRVAEEQSTDLAHVLRRGGERDARAAVAAYVAAVPEDRRAAVLAATLDTLSGPWNTPVRFLARHRAAVWSVSFLLANATNYLLSATRVVDISLWGWLWMLPMALVELRFAQARRLARERVLARLEAEWQASGPAAGPTAGPTSGRTAHQPIG